MPCHHPIRASRTKSGTVAIGKELPDSTWLRLPCGKCLGCRMARAKEWALRCHLELAAHPTAVFTTLTYSDENLPNTLEKRHVQLWLKRLREQTRSQTVGPFHTPIRFFLSGEYGEKTKRPHYHAILFGLAVQDGKLIEKTWGLGHTRTTPCTPARIAYVAGYAAKKIGYSQSKTEVIDPTTGELLYEWQPPFIQMSRKPGLGACAREYHHSWRLYALMNGQKQPVPRFLHEAWKERATPHQIEELCDEKHRLTLNRDKSPERLAAAEHQLQQKTALKNQRRIL